jgi:hypothetical protein
MQSFPFSKLDQPSEQEIAHAIEIGHEIVAIACVNDTERMFLKFLCRSGEQTVVWIDAFLVDHLARCFERTLLGNERDPGHPVRTTFESQEVTSLGVVPRDPLD